MGVAVAGLLVDSRHLALTVNIVGPSLGLRLFPKPARWVRYPLKPLVALILPGLGQSRIFW